MIDRNIKFGLMVEDSYIFQWQFNCIINLLEMKNVKIKLVIINSTKYQEESLLKRMFSKYRRFLLLLFRKYFINSKSLTKKKYKELFQNKDKIHCKALNKGKYSQYFSREDILKIKSYNLDFIIQFGFKNIRGDILNLAKYGIWTYHHDFEERYGGSPPFFWEIFFNNPIIVITLQKLTEKIDGNVIIKRGIFRTENSSYKKNLDRILMEVAKWPTQICKNILINKTPYFNSPTINNQVSIFYKPKNSNILSFLIKLVINNIKLNYNRLFKHDKWKIGIINKRIQEIYENNVSLNEIQWFPEPEYNYYYADPFGVKKENELLVLFEKFNYINQKGIISSFLNDNFISINIYSKKCHLSYPFLLTYKNKIFCIPDSHECKNIILLECKEFPFKWEFKDFLIRDIPAIDPTIFFYRKKWWLFLSRKDNLPDTNLFIYFSDDLFGPWYEHPKNPVKTNVKSSRSAGTPFIYNGNLIRPSQDCSVSYGYQIIFNKIITLNEFDFREKNVKTLKLNKFNGNHTINSLGDKTLIDVKYYKFNFNLFKKSLKNIYNRFKNPF